jgi:hypothetical protein
VLCSCLELAACSDQWLEGGGEICFCESSTVYSDGFRVPSLWREIM